MGEVPPFLKSSHKYCGIHKICIALIANKQTQVIVNGINNKPLENLCLHLYMYTVEPLYSRHSWDSL